MKIKTGYQAIYDFNGVYSKYIHVAKFDV